MSSKHFPSRIVGILATTCLAFIMALGIPTFALAESNPNNDSESFADTAGNLFFAGTSADYSGESLENSLFWAGQDLNISESSIGSNAFCAGQSMAILNSKIDSSVFIAGQNAIIKESAINGNLFVAGSSLSFGENSSAKALYSATQFLDFRGNAKYMFAIADQAILDGTIDGDAVITADVVTIKPDTVIKGKLEVRGSEEPEIPASAQIGEFKFVKMDTEAMEKAADEAEGALAVGAILSFIGSLFGAAVVGLLIYWLNRRTLSTAASYLRTRPVALLISGLVTIICLPVVAIIGFIAFCWPISLSLIMLAAIITLLATAFTGASLLQLIAPKLNPIAASALGAAALTLLSKIPFIGFVFGLFAVLYATGFVIQWIFLNSMGKPSSKESPATQEPLKDESSDIRNQPPVAPMA